MTNRFLVVCLVFLLALAGGTAVARAQETPAPEAATPAPEAATPTPTSGSLTPMDRAYDGNLHVTLAPYIWLPTLNQSLRFTVPTLPQHGGAVLESNVRVGPSDYLAKINSALMFAFDVRKGTVNFFGDYIYSNASTSANVATTITGPLGHVSIPVRFSVNSRLASSIWEVGVGTTLAHGHNADLNLFFGWRQFPLNLTLSYNAVIGQNGIIAPSGTIVSRTYASSLIGGLQGKAFFNENHWFVPYYIDLGAGFNNNTWQGYTGAGYMFNHGQTVLLTYRVLGYSGLPQASPVQKLTMSGPLFGYTFGVTP
jgi:hypothetical protein